MPTTTKTIIMSLALALAVRPSGAAAAAPKRVDKDIKLNAPLELLAEVKAYLASRYADPKVLRRFADGPVTSDAAAEDFTDVYYDTRDLKMQKVDAEVRHRRRYADATLTEKTKEWIQVKLPSSERNAPEEIKFKVAKSVAKLSSSFGSEPVHPFLQLLRRSEAASVEAALQSKLRTSAAELVPVLVLRQHRDRVYIRSGNDLLYTMTVDRVKTGRLWAEVELGEVEIEINEIVYSRTAAPAEKARLNRLQGEIADDLLARFPALRQEQVPRYEKLYRAVAAKLAPIPLGFLLRWGLL